MRGIDQRFIDDLLRGELSFFLEQVRSRRKELSLEIRGGYINIYYRGGNLLKITQKRKGYTFQFDPKYCLNKGDDSHYEDVCNLKASSVDDYVNSFNLLIAEMQSWLLVHPKPEREYQHQLLIHNESIIDIEYQIKKMMRLDMLMVRDDVLVVVENKYGTGAISGSAGLAKHYKDICTVLTTQVLKDEIYDSVSNIAECKQQLGLLTFPVHLRDRSKHEILFLLADYNPKSESIRIELKEIRKTIPAKVLFNVADEYVVDFSSAKDLFTL